METVESLVARLSALQINQQFVECGILVKRIAKQRWQIGEQYWGIRKGAKKLQLLLVEKKLLQFRKI